MSPLPALPDDPAADEAVRHYLDSSMPPTTRRSYESAWRVYRAWCKATGHEPFAGDNAIAAGRQLARFVAAEADRGIAASTITGRLAGIGKVLEARLHANPAAMLIVRQTLKGVKEQAAAAGGQGREKDALTPAMIRRLVDDLSVDAGQARTDQARLLALRDRAMVLALFAGALRAGDLREMQVTGLRFEPPRGVAVFLARSKGDRGRRGVVIPLHAEPDERYCPMRALRIWIEAAGLREGAVFRAVGRNGALGRKALTYEGVRRRLMRLFAGLGLDQAQLARLGTHSFRVGWATGTIAAQRRATGSVDVTGVMRHARWKNAETMARYERIAQLWDSAPGKGLLSEG